MSAVGCQYRLVNRGVWPKCILPDPETSTFHFTNGGKRCPFSCGEWSGPPRQGAPSCPDPVRSHYVIASGSSTSKPIFSAKKASVHLKVFQANVSNTPGGKFEFHKLGQTFIDVNDWTANVVYITRVVEKKWGGVYVLVTSDGLKIEDSSGTQGATHTYHVILSYVFDGVYCNALNRI